MEYYTMISWVRPGFLENESVFKETFVAVIEAGERGRCVRA